jgi:hypothetical protein
MGNVQAIVKAIIESIGEFGLSFDSANCPWYCLSIAQYTTLMEEVGFRVTYAAHFDRLTPLEDGENGMRNWISMFAGSFFESIPKDKYNEIIEQVENKLRKDLFHEGTWFADYKRIRVVGVKENS